MRTRSRCGPLVALAALALLVVLIGAPASGYSRHHSAAVTVSDKERVCSTRSCTYLVFTDRTTYRVSDSILFAHRVTSSDFYGQIKVCHRYQIVYYGWRVGLLSWYQNIISAQDLGSAVGCTPGR